MHQLTQTDLHFVVRRIPKDIRQILSASHGLLFLGGGFVRDTIAGLEVKDIDLLGANVHDMEATAKRLTDARASDGIARMHTTDNAITVLSPPRLPVQFITRWTFGSAEEAAASFDFSICQAVVWRRPGDSYGSEMMELGLWSSVCSDDFYPDLAARRLRYTYPVREEEAGGSLMRVRKFLARGWNIQADSLGGVVARVAQKIEWDKLTTERYGNPQERERAVAGVVSGLLREVDPLLLVDGLDAIEDPGEGA